MPATTIMPAAVFSPAAPPRPQHKRNQSSKSALLRALIGSDSPVVATDTSLDSDPTSKTRVLSERHGNTQTTPAAPTKGNFDRKQPAPDRLKGSKIQSPSKTTKSSNLASVLAKINRSSKDLSTLAQKYDKENSTPPSSPHDTTEPPIWAQFVTTRETSIEDEIARYTPQEYNPGLQRNFSGTIETPKLRPTLARNSRPQSAHLLSSDRIVGAIGRRVSGGRSSTEYRSSEDSSRKIQQDRKTSGSSTEQPPVKEKLNIQKRTGRVMAAVAALQRKPKDSSLSKQADSLDSKAVDEAFEAVLEARNIPEAQRQQMRTLTLRVKADFVRQDNSTSKISSTSPPGTSNSETSGVVRETHGTSDPLDGSTRIVEDEKTTKRSRARSRTFTFSRSDRKGESSSPKKQRSQSRSNLAALVVPKDSSKGGNPPATPSTPTGSLGRKSAPPSYPADYIAYLRGTQDPTKAEVGRLHKLRLLLRNETVAWVDSFISLDGMAEIVNLLDRTMQIEWREEHEDQLLHETLLCLKGLCTIGRAMEELDRYADKLFPQLLAMLFDDEKRGPAEYSTRTIVINILFNFLASVTTNTTMASTDIDNHARRILKYIREPQKADDERPVDFVLDMRVSRPYKLWCREVSNVSKEVFWIFLHNLNVVPSPKLATTPSGEDDMASSSNINHEERSSYASRNFPGSRPPVPAAPYIGGVEWDATTYIAAHLDLLNGLIASISSCTARNALREDLCASGFEKLLGGTLRTCKEKFYSCVHDGLRAWVAAAAEDGWETRFVREGPTEEESPKRSPAKRKKDDAPPPKLDVLPKLGSSKIELDDDAGGWLG